MTLQERLAPGKYKLRVEDYLRLDETGAFGNERTELLNGDIIVMNAEYRPHAWVRDELVYRLRRALQGLDNGLTATGGSIHVSAHDMPMPDISLTREPRGEGPIPLTSVALCVEVASTTLRRDMADKVVIYARSGIAEYWVVDLDGRVIHQMWNPVGDVYRDRREPAFGLTIISTTVSGLHIETAGI